MIKEIIQISKNQLQSEIVKGGVNVLKSILNRYAYNNLHLLNISPITRFNRLLYNSKLNTDHIFEKYINYDYNCNMMKEGMHYLELDKYTYMVITCRSYFNDINNELRYELNIYILGLNKDKYYNDICKGIQQRPKINGNDIIVIDSNNKGTPIKSVKPEDIITRHKDDIINYITNWMNNKKLFKKFNILYKTGILLYGPPGTGKSSVVRLIASITGYTIREIDLGVSLNELKSMVIYEYSILLFEDVDCLVRQRSSEINSKIAQENESKLNFVLNIIDGINSVNNTIAIATTNYYEKLDTAFTRDGRFNLKVKLDNFNEEEALEMCKKYKIHHNILHGESFPINPAYLENKIIKYKLAKRGI